MSNFEYYAAAKELVVLLKTAGHADEAAKLQSAMDDGATGTEIFMALRFHLSRIVDAIQLSGAAQTLASRLLAELNKALP